MLQLFAEQTIDPVGKPAVVRSGLGSFLIHAVVFLLVLSLGYWPAVQRFPDRLTRVMLVAPLPPPPPVPLVKSARVPVHRTARVFSAMLTAPVAIPEHAAVTVGVVESPPDVEVVAGVPGGIPGGVPGGISGGILPTFKPPPAPPPPTPHEVKAAKPPESQPPERIQVSSEIQEAKLLVMIPPEYPPMAKKAHIQGAVHLTAVIDRDGNVTELKVLDGNPLLVQAACTAVGKWRYRPTLLHGEAVEVVTGIIVNFRLMT
jgi:periplasmic protein TonB